jgi:hypothetical protein
MAEDTTDVKKASETSGEAKPMAEAPVEPTDAQREAAGTDAKPSDAALAQVREDAKWREDNPNKVLIREANPAVAGESFDYLGQN